MAEIDNNTPLQPVWPRKPVRRIDPEEESEGEKQRQQRRGRQNQKNKKDDGGHPRIDEYV